MHELSVCMSLLDQVQAIAAERNASRVTRIELTVGPLSGIEIDLLENAWPMAAADSIADDCEFVVTPTAIVVRCSQCETESEAAANNLVCPACGHHGTSVVSGEEMILQRLELESSADSG